MAEYAGNRWYKCDLHLHTMYSKCYLEKENTPQEWVARALEQGLNAVAVTDHNDYRGISEMMEEGKAQGLAVFPGVEITCDSSKIHMLILFDTDKRAENVRDFLNRCDIDSDHIGDPDGTSMGVFEICEIAKKRGAMVIAAHIDEFNSINSMNSVNLEKLLSGGYIDAVQVANVPIWRKYKMDKDVKAMEEALRNKYGADATPQEVDRWRKCYNRAEEMGLPMLAFSDNPASPTESKHGLDGIGSVYTWIQMDDVVNLESIRQSLYTAESRIRMMFDSEDEPKTEPNYWIRSIEVRKTELNPHQPIRFEFHPQLNCIIGGKGSGKSTAVRVMLGVCNQLSGTLLLNTLAQQNRFYARNDEENAGIFREDSEIEVCFRMYGTDYRLLVNEIRGMNDQKESFFVTDKATGEEIPVAQREMLHAVFSRVQVFAQRQINEITTTKGALLDLTDRSIDGLRFEKARKEYCLEQLVNLSARLHAAGRFLKYEERIRSELTWFQKVKQMSGLLEELKNNIDEGTKRREEALQHFDACWAETDVLHEQRKKTFEEYEASLTRIRELRSDFIEKVLAEDENYKMELVPMADRDSFHAMLKQTLKGDESLMAEDMKKLDAAIFAKKNGIANYTKLLLEARTLSILPDREESKSSDGLSPYFAHLIKKLPEASFDALLLYRPEDELDLFYKPNGVKRFFPMTTASSGEKSTAILSFILSGSNAPLLIDQPEDDMDNRVIYEEVVPKLKKAKQKRQLIIVTHNANIAMNADPEMIIVMDSKSKFIKARMQGSVDNDEIRKEICDVIEGTKEGFVRRARKYHVE